MARSVSSADACTARPVLVVEPSRLQRRILCQRLVAMGHRAIEAEDGDAAARRLQEAGEPPHAIIIAWEAGGATGPQWIRRWQAHADHRWIPALVVTSHLDPERIHEAFDSGAVDFLRKPYEPIELDARLRSALRLRDAQIELRDLASTDPLTGLPNRRAFMERLAQEWSRSRRYETEFSVAIGDVDHFKQVNDRFGHDVGDVVLKGIAELLADRIRTTDCAARIGGEEFALLLPETDREGAGVILDRVRLGIDALVWPIPGLETTISIGFVSCGAVAVDAPEPLLALADRALYAAKDAGRNALRFAFGDDD